MSPRRHVTPSASPGAGTSPEKAFTLIELMLVVIIIGVLAAMVMPRLVGRSEEARVSAARADINSNIALGLDMYEMHMGHYPASLIELTEKGSNPDAWKGPYLKKAPKDPWGKDYHYASPGIHNSDYDLYSAGPNGIEGDNDDIGNW